MEARESGYLEWLRLTAFHFSQFAGSVVKSAVCADFELVQTGLKRLDSVMV